jgi:gliding motility-associated-like protein
VEIFDLTDAADDITDSEPNLVLSYHTSQEDADNDANAIPNFTAYPSATATIYVRVEANTGNPNDAVCYQVVELPLIVNPLPALGTNGVIKPYAICQLTFTGTATFMLNSHIGAILPVGADPADYVVRFYFDQAALTAGTALPNQYTNIATPQTILVWVQHIATGCIKTASMDLLVEQQAVANVPVDAYLEYCDEDGTNDGVYEFDLTSFNAAILGTQNPAVYSVTYFESEADALANQNAIPNPATYRNVFSPDVATIYVAVINTASISGCPAYTTVELRVERLLEPHITSTGNAVCIDYKTGETVGPLTLNSNITGTGYTYDWYLNGDLVYTGSEPTYDALVEGEYTVEVTSSSALGCTSDMSAAFTVIKSGPASIIDAGYIVTNAFSDSQVITVTVEGYGIYKYQLDNGPLQDSAVFTNVSPGEHTISIYDTKGDNACDTVVLSSVSVIDYPNFFTPNGDGYNDTWNIIGLGDQGDAKIYIFDRYGKLIKQISSLGDGWDGTYNGNQLPADDYWFTVTYRETNPNGESVVKEFKSHFALKR